MPLASLLETARQRSAGEGRKRGGQYIGHHRNHAMPAQSDQRQRHFVVAGIHRQMIGTPRQQVAYLRNAPRGFLDPRHRGNLLRQRQHGFRENIETRAARHVVQYDGTIRGGGDSLYVGPKAGLRRFVVIRPHHKQPVGAGGLRLLRKNDALACGVVARAHNDGYAPRHMRYGVGHQPLALGGPDRGVLARRAQHDQRFHALRNLPVHVPTKRFVIDAVSIRSKRRYERDARAGKKKIAHACIRVR